MKTPNKKRRSTFRTNSSIEQMEDKKLFAADLLSIAEVGQVAQIAQLDTRLTITQNASISINDGVVTATATNNNDVITIEEYSLGKINDFLAQTNTGNLNPKMGFNLQGIQGINAIPASTPAQGVDSFAPLLPRIRVTIETEGGELLKQQTFQQLDVDRVDAYGLSGNDQIVNNTSVETRMYGGSGNDTMDGGSGRDWMYGQDGDDHMEGHDGNDHVSGGMGNDQVYGRAGNDYVAGGIGNDLIFGNAGNDAMSGGVGNDMMYGGAGNDEIDGDEGNDRLEGGAGNDTLSGESGNDIMEGGSGNDTMWGGYGNDDMEGDSGNDRMWGHAGNDDMDGGSGDDTMYGGEGYDDMIGGYGNDWMSGGDHADDMDGRQGNDTMYGGNGNDDMQGYYGEDNMYGDAGNDDMNGGMDDDIMRGGSGNDEMDGYHGDDLMYGNDGHDDMEGGSGDDTMYGNDGNDEISGDSGADLLYGGNGRDVIFGGFGNDLMYGGAGNDRLRGNSGNDSLYGEDHRDTLYGGSGNDYLSGGQGDDGLYGGSGSDELRGGSDDDRFLVLNDVPVNFLFWEVGMTSADEILDKHSNDAKINFEHGEGREFNFEGLGNSIIDDGTFTPAEIELVDESLEDLHRQTGNAKLLKRKNGNEITFRRLGAQIGGSFNLGGVNSGDVITLLDASFDSGSDWLAQVVFHEVGHNWDNENDNWNQWKNISGWRESWASGHTLSGDGQWYHDSDATFARNYGKSNPREDFATYFAKVMMDDNGLTYGGSGSNATKEQFFDDFFASL